MKKKKSSAMNKLMGEFKGVIEKNDLGEARDYNPTYSTGIDILDYRNGKLDNGGELSVGIGAGKIFTVVGKPGSGKTSLAIKVATTIAEQYEDSNIVHFDFENATTTARIKAISGWSEELIEEKYLKLNRSIYSESLYQFIKAAAKIKLNDESLLIDSGVVDSEGNEIKVLPPTIILVDSWALVVPKDYAEEDKLSGQDLGSGTCIINSACA